LKIDELHYIAIYQLCDSDTVKISDFGLSTVFRHMGKERKLSRRCGTPPYIAPEVHAGLDYNAEPADIWSCGIVLVAMLAGELPWDAPTSQCPEYCEWCMQNYFFSPWNKISNEPLALLKKILLHTPSKRPTIDSIRSHVWCRKTYPVVELTTQEALSAVSPSHRHSSRRPRIESSPRYADRNNSEISSSQPGPVDRESVDGGEVEVAVESFTQPSRYDELVISTQVPCTPGATETPVQRLTLRLTRFYTATPCQRVWSRLQQVMKKFSYDVRTSPDKVSLVVSTNDSRSQPLVFKASIYGLRSDLLLVDFRRSTGDGIEFKKIFKKVREQCQEIIVKPPQIH
jgi:serine/threonine-protein kinase Chk1